MRIKDYYQKVKKYKFKIFSYSDTSKLRIFFNIFRLILCQSIKKSLVKANVNNYKMFLDLQTPGLSNALFVYGKREILDTYLVKEELTDDMAVLDIGANIGYYVLLEASQLDKGRVYAFEPDPRNIKLLEKNIKLNNFEDKVKIYPYAVSNKNETKTFYLGERTNVSSFIKREDVVDKIDVRCIKLDDFFSIDTIDLIRMDIEGYECQVLEGMRNFLTNTKKPIKLLIEIHSFAYNNEFNFKKQLQYLFEHGFCVKYLISTKKDHVELSDLGYKAIKHGTETENVRSLYKNIETKDILFLLDRDLIRSIMLEKIR